MSVRHNTPADPNFTPRGKVAWEEDHVGGTSTVVSVWEYLTVAELADVQAETRLLDVTASFQRACDAAIGKTLYVPKGKYSIQSAGGVVLTGRVKIVGDGIQSTFICRDFSPASDSIGALNLGTNNASIVEDIQFVSKTGTTGGCLLSIVSSASVASSFMHLRNLDLTFDAVNTYKYALYIDGTAKTVAPVGARDITLNSVVVFGGTSGAAFLNGAVNLNWTGGGTFAGGSTSAAVEVTGDASVSSTSVGIFVSEVGALTLDRITFFTFAGKCSGNLTNTSNSANCSIVGETAGTTQTNWTNSQLVRNGQIALFPADASSAVQIAGTGSGNTQLGFRKSSSVTQIQLVGAVGTNFAVPDGQTFTFTMGSIATMFWIRDNGGKAGLFFATNASATITIISDPSSYFENSATPTAGKFGVFKSAAANAISVINSVGSQRTIGVLAMGQIDSTTDPA